MPLPRAPCRNGLEEVLVCAPSREQSVACIVEAQALDCLVRVHVAAKGGPVVRKHVRELVAPLAQHEAFMLVGR